jgi:hypothetical protein
VPKTAYWGSMGFDRFSRAKDLIHSTVSSAVPILSNATSVTTGLYEPGWFNLSRIARSVALLPALFGPTIRVTSLGLMLIVERLLNAIALTLNCGFTMEYLLCHMLRKVFLQQVNIIALRAWVCSNAPKSTAAIVNHGYYRMELFDASVALGVGLQRVHSRER